MSAARGRRRGTSHLVAASIAAVASFASVTSIAVVARAEPSDEERALADVRFREGRDLLDKLRYDDACPKFDESERLWPRGGTVLNLATCREKQGKSATAWAAYTRALVLAQKEGRIDREEVAKKKIAELQAELSWLVIQVPQELDVAGTVVTRDGAPIGRGAWGVPVPVDPGRHVIVANAPGVPPIESVVEVGPHGDRKTVLIPHPGAPPQAVAPQLPIGIPGFVFGQPRPPAELGPPGVVRLHVDTKDEGVGVFAMRSFGPVTVSSGLPLCVAPCDTIIDGRDGQKLYVEGEGSSRSATFSVADRRGDLVAHVSTGSAVLVRLGATTAGLGGASAIAGAVLMASAAAFHAPTNRFGDQSTNSGVMEAGGVMLAVGGGVLAAGIIMIIAGRTTVNLDDAAPTRNAATVPRLTPNGVAIAF